MFGLFSGMKEKAVLDDMRTATQENTIFLVSAYNDIQVPYSSPEFYERQADRASGILKMLSVQRLQVKERMLGGKESLDVAMAYNIFEAMLAEARDVSLKTVELCQDKDLREYGSSPENDIDEELKAKVIAKGFAVDDDISTRNERAKDKTRKFLRKQGSEFF